MSFEDQYKQAHAKAEAASDAYNAVNIANRADPRLPALQEARDDANAARADALAALQASRPAPTQPPPSAQPGTFPTILPKFAQVILSLCITQTILALKN